MSRPLASARRRDAAREDGERGQDDGRGRRAAAAGGGVARGLGGADGTGVVARGRQDHPVLARREAGPAEALHVRADGREERGLARRGDPAGEDDDLHVQYPEQIRAAEREVRARGVDDGRGVRVAGRGRGEDSRARKRRAGTRLVPSREFYFYFFFRISFGLML